MLRLLPLLLAGALAPATFADSATEIVVADDVGLTVSLPAPARRIVSLAPHATEILFAAGAGDRIVATVDYSDHPPAARDIPRVGGSGGLDLERIVALKPDLIVAWSSGNPRQSIERLRAFGFPVYLTEAKRLADIAQAIERLGRLAGTETVARDAAARFTARQARLAAPRGKRAPIRVFYQVVDPLLVTVSGRHLISEVLRLCGGENIFADLPVLAPVVSEEAVLNADPQAIIAGGIEVGWRPWKKRWQERRQLTAAKRGTIYFVHADDLHRSGPRVLEGAERVCLALEDARGRLKREEPEAK